MATLYTNRDKNIIKTWVLMGLFLAIVVALGWFLSYYYNSPELLYVAVGFALFMNVLSYWHSDKIVLKLTGAREASRQEFFDLYNAVENLAITAGLPKPRVYVIDDPAPNAFATGRDPAHAVVAVTTGLLAILDKTELEGVIAHELSHIGNRDILLSTVVAVLVGFIAILSDIFIRSSLWGGGGRRSNDSKAGGVLMIIGLALIILSPVIATLIQLAISRRREYLADASGALLTRYPEGLAAALQKISAHSRPLQRASNATAHLFIANPFGRVSRGLHKLFLTHPPTEDRVQALLGHN